MPPDSTIEGLDKLLEPFSWFEARRLRRTPKQLDFRLRALFVLQWIAFFALLGASLLVLVLLGPVFALEHPVALAIVVFVAVSRHVWGLYGLLGGEAVRFDEAPAKLRGNVDKEDIESVVECVGRRFGRREVPNVFIAIDEEANALTANSMLFNSIPRYNAVFLNSFLFKALSRDELLAIVAHELAHFHRYMGPLARNAWLGVVGSVAACVAIFSWDPEIVELPLLAALVVWWVPLPFLWLFNKIATRGRHSLELACDAVAADVVGAESMINALLKMGDRLEVLELVERELKRHLEENPRAAAEKSVQALLERVPERPVTPTEARRILRLGPLPENERGDRVKRRRLLSALLQNRKLRKALDVVSWSRFDTIRRDGRLDRDELELYVRSLRSSTVRGLTWWGSVSPILRIAMPVRHSLINRLAFKADT